MSCWRLSRADRVAVLVDGDAYYRALASALARARESVLLLGWDLNPDVEVARDETGAGETFGELLEERLAARETLHVHLLSWDFSVVYAFERQLLPLFRLAWTSHPRLHLSLDGRHPTGACHHQKLVVVDDAVAFAGGLDLTAERWDTPGHRSDDPRRRRPGDGEPYGPFHDVQMAVAGEAAVCLGELARERWRRATGERLRAPWRGGDRWPETLATDFEETTVGIVRTEPAWEERPAVREVERLYLDSIAAARRSIYIENQYLSSRRLVDALATRLAEADGPEVVMVLPVSSSGWLEEATMDVWRARVVDVLRRADHHARLAIYRPVAADGETPIYVHAKAMVIDDRLLRVGSSNLSNRSLGLDTELDLAVEAEGDGAVARGVARLRARLLAEHLGVDPERVERAIGDGGSLIDAVEGLRGPGRSLVPLEVAVPGWLEDVIPPADLLDPTEPIALDQLSHRYLSQLGRPLPTWRETLSRSGLALGALLLAGWGGWALTTTEHPADLPAMMQTVRALADHPATLVASVIGFAVGELLFVPWSVLTVVVVAAFGIWPGAAWSLAGALLGAAVAYAGGRRLDRELVRRLAGRRLNLLTRRLLDRGPRGLVALHLLPLVPASAVHGVAGATGLSFGRFLLGAAQGLVPGILALAVVGELLARYLLAPSWPRLALVLAGMALVGVGTQGVRWLLLREGRGVTVGEAGG